MKQWLNLHKPFWISLLITLAAALLTITAVACAVLPTAKEQAIQTLAAGTEESTKAAEADSEQEENRAEETEKPNEPELLPYLTPTPTLETSIADRDLAIAIDQNILNLSQRRSRDIPFALPFSRGTEEREKTMQWETCTDQAEIERLYSVANHYAHELLGCYLFEPIVIQYSKDDGIRPSVIQIRDMMTIITLDRETEALLNADTAWEPDYRMHPEMNPTGEERKVIEDSVFETLKKTRTVQSAVMNGIPATDGTIVGIGYAYGKVYSVSVYPDRICAGEYVYFPADVRHSLTYVEPVSAPESFEKTEPNTLEANHADNLTKQQVLDAVNEFYRMIVGKSYEGEAEVTAYLDRSGAREDYWEVKIKDLYLKIAAQSGLVLSMKGSLARGEGSALPELKPNIDRITSEEFEKTYLEFVKQLAPWFASLGRGREGSAVKDVDWNATYDTWNATLDIYLEDGTVYELLFSSGRLREIQYFYDEPAFGFGPAGQWKPSALYRNKISGEEFYSPEPPTD